MGKWHVRLAGWILASALFLLTAIPVQAVQTGLEGKTLSVLGDSISTYGGVSDNWAYNITLSGSAVFYTPGRHGIYQGDTWWQQAADALGMELLVNNSWSGSCMLQPGGGTEGAYLERCVQLHSNDGREPDIIAIFLGTNDQDYFADTLGSFRDIDFDSLILREGDGFRYAEPETTMEAYAIALHKIRQRYPQAEVYCFALLQRPVANPFNLLVFNTDLGQLAEFFEATRVHLFQCGIRTGQESFPVQMADYVHPAPAGMDAISGAFVSTILRNSRYVSEWTALREVSWELEDVVAMEDVVTTAVYGKPLTVRLAGVPGKTGLQVQITMDGKDITRNCYADGVVSIEEVTGDVHIRARAQ